MKLTISKKLLQTDKIYRQMICVSVYLFVIFYTCPLEAFVLSALSNLILSCDVGEMADRDGSDVCQSSSQGEFIYIV